MKILRNIKNWGVRLNLHKTTVWLLITENHIIILIPTGQNATLIIVILW